MDFKVSTLGEVHRILIPPLLFIPLVQYATKEFQKKGDYFFMNVRFQSTTDFISFSCDCRNPDLFFSEKFDKVKLRLDSLFKERYQLEPTFNQEKENPTLHLQLNL